MNTINAAAKQLGLPVSYLHKHKIRYDMGKYALTIKNREQPANANCVLWYECRKDSDGPYLALYTLEKIVLPG